MVKAINWLKLHKIFSSVLILAFILAGYFFYQKYRSQNPEDLYLFSTAEIMDLTQTVTASGTIKSKTQVDLKFPTAGLLSWVNVQEGDKVKKWQLLAGLDTRELEIGLKKYLLDFAKERHDFDEDIKVTYRDKVLTDTISRILDKNQYDLEKAVLDVELKNLAIQLSVLSSPINGIVIKSNIPAAGINLPAGTTVLTIADPNNLVFEAEIDEVDIAKIKVGQTAQLILDAYPNQPLNLTVDSIDFQSTTDAAGSTIYLVKFNLANDQLNPLYRLGMNGEITISTMVKNQVLAVPSEAIFNNQVQILQDKKIIQQSVVTGIESDTHTEIISGLQPGQKVVIGNKPK